MRPGCHNTSVGDSDSPQPNKLRAIWLSDIHLGWSPCRTEILLDFLKHHDAEVWYLIGDVIDGWMLRRDWHWPQAHNDVIQKLLRKARKGARLFYIPGNHDEFMRQFAGTSFGAIRVAHDWMHETADGRRFWVLHGDEFDTIVRFTPWLAELGGIGYDWIIHIGNRLNQVRRRFGMEEWSLAAYVKSRVKNVAKRIAGYEKALARAARRRGADGVICGHIHQPECRNFGTIQYYNVGDWVEHCTALLEHHDGRMESMRWPPRQALHPLAAAARAKNAPGFLDFPVRSGIFPRHGRKRAFFSFATRHGGTGCAQ